MYRRECMIEGVIWVIRHGGYREVSAAGRTRCVRARVRVCVWIGDDECLVVIAGVWV